MTSSNHHAPRVHRLRYEPTATPAASVACPHCGGTVDPAEPRAEARPDVRIVPPVVSFDVAPAWEPVARELRIGRDRRQRRSGEMGHDGPPGTVGDFEVDQPDPTAHPSPGTSRVAAPAPSRSAPTRPARRGTGTAQSATAT
ncbi:MAG: hypothetical protein L0H64_17900 [Pseudonocardia sp.]|nr:hypothetical protein [Pseudonocardia sp.]